MAYTFDRINSLFGKPGEDTRNKAPEENKSMGNYGEVKTTSGGDLSSTDSAGATNTGGESAVPQNFTSNNAAAIKRNVAKAQNPSAVNKIQADLGSAQTNLQNEANSYVEDYKNKNYGVAQDDINAAVEGDSGKISNIAQRYQKKDYGSVDQFAPKTDYDIEDAALLGSEGGVKRLLARDAGDRYTAGEGAFDVGLLRRNNNFNLIADQLRRQQTNLQNEANTLKTEKTKAAQTEADTRYQAETGNLEQALKAREAEQLTAAEQAAKAVNDKRAALRAQGDQSFIEQNKQAALQEALKDIMAYNPRARRFYDNLNVDPNKFYQVGGDVGYKDVMTQDQAARFNRIQDIMGTGRSEMAGSGPGEDQKFDVTGLTNYARDTTLAQRAKADEDQKALIRSIEEANKKRVYDYNLARQSDDEKAFNDAKNRIMIQLTGVDANNFDPERAKMLARLEQLRPKTNTLPKNRGPVNPNSSYMDIPSITQQGFSGIAGDDEYTTLLRQFQEKYPAANITTSVLQNPLSSYMETPYGKYAKMNNAQLNLRDFVSERPEAYWDQALSEDEVNKYNAALEDLGSPAARLQASKGLSKAQVKENELRSALLRAMNAR